MRGLRRRVRGRIGLALLMAVLVVVIVLTSGGVALANVWKDISDSQWQTQYGITAAQAQSVAAGYADGTFHPTEAVKRGQFAKMVVDGFDLDYWTPSTGSSFPDVPRAHTFFKYVETGVKVGVLAGYTDGTYKPNNTISRQQANSILGKYLAAVELEEENVITGSKGTYTSLNSWYAAEGALLLAQFTDAANVAAVHAPGTAYLVYRQVVKGSNGYLAPGSTLTRAQAVAMIIRVRETTFGGPGSVPTVTSISPTGGPVTGGTVVTITGTNFVQGATVSFGPGYLASSVIVLGSTSITCVAPAHPAGVVDVTVTTPAGTSSTAGTANDFSYGLPTVTALSPTGGPTSGGTAVTITGTNFVSGATVNFGSGYPATNVNVVNSTTITCVTPAHPVGVAEVTVTTPAGTSSTAGTANDFSYGLPTITALNPTGGPTTGGTFVTITGTNFVSGATVAFGGTNYPGMNVSVISSTTITCYAPSHPVGTVDVTVTTPAGTSPTAGTANDYVYGGPTITSISPSSGPTSGGTLVTITGTNFVTGATVAFGPGLSATNVTVVNSTTITCVTPPRNTPGTVEVTVTTSAGTSLTAGAGNEFTYVTGKLAMVTQPSNAVNGVAFATQPAVRLTDNFNNNLALAGVVVTASISPGTASLSGGTTATTNASGIATFSNLKVVGTAGNYTLTFSATGVTPVTSSPFALGAGAATKVVLTTQPSGAVSGVALTGAPVAQLRDSGNNNVTTSGVVITASLATGSGTLSGTTSATTNSSGAATFSNLIITGNPGNYSLTFSSTGLTSATSASFSLTAAYASAPTVELLKGSADPVPEVVNVQLPAPGGTDSHGKVLGWVANTADQIRFTVSDMPPATSTITINGYPYASGTDYTISAPGTLSIVVTTSESGKSTATRTFLVSVTGPVATAPTVTLAAGSTNPAGGVEDVNLPQPGETDNSGKVKEWVGSTACNIKFTVTDNGSATSVVTINGAAYTSGDDYTITAPGTLTIVVTTNESGKTTAVRTFKVAVTQVVAPGPQSVNLLSGITNGVPTYGITPVEMPDAGKTDNHGKIVGWVANTQCNIRFLVVDQVGSSSTITINGAAYISGNDYKIAGIGDLTIVVTTSAPGMANSVRTFTVAVSGPYATAPSAVSLASGVPTASPPHRSLKCRYQIRAVLTAQASSPAGWLVRNLPSSSPSLMPVRPIHPSRSMERPTRAGPILRSARPPLR